MRSLSLLGLCSLGILFAVQQCRAEVTQPEVEEAIARAVAFLEKEQQPAGNWPEMAAEPRGVSALCTLALLHSGRTAGDPSVEKALDYFGRSPDPTRTYSASLLLMVYVRADPVRYKVQSVRLAEALISGQSKDPKFRGGWSYERQHARADNSNTGFAIMALHEAHRAGVRVNAETWRMARDYWLQPGMQHRDGGFGYLAGLPTTGSMTCTAIKSLRIAQDHLILKRATRNRDVLAEANEAAVDEVIERAWGWLELNFSAERNPKSEQWLRYYQYALRQAAEQTGRVFLNAPAAVDERVVNRRNLFQECATDLVRSLNPASTSRQWLGNVESDPLIGTSLGLLALAPARRPLVIGALHVEAQTKDSEQVRRPRRLAVQKLADHAGQQWHCELDWHLTHGKTTDELLAAPVLLISVPGAFQLEDDQEQAILGFVENGGVILAEASGNTDEQRLAFDHSLRQLLKKLLPSEELQELSKDHPVWDCEVMVAREQLPRVPLWGLQNCCRTTVFYCPWNISGRWQVTNGTPSSSGNPRLGQEGEIARQLAINILSYATGGKFRHRLEQPINTVRPPSSAIDPKAITIGKLTDVGRVEARLHTLERLLPMATARYLADTPLRHQDVSLTDKRLSLHPILFLSGREKFALSPDQREGLKNYLAGGGCLFAEAIGGSDKFAAALREELTNLFPNAPLLRLRSDHKLYTESFPGFRMATVKLRDPLAVDVAEQLADRIVLVPPLLEGLELSERLAVIFSPNDISCALQPGLSLEHKSLMPDDAERIGVNVVLYALQQRFGRLR